MSKKIDLHVNLDEMELLQFALNSLHLPDLSRDEQKLYQRLDEMLNERISQMQEDELYTEDKDGYSKLTKTGREALAEKYQRED